MDDVRLFDFSVAGSVGHWIAEAGPIGALTGTLVSGLDLFPAPGSETSEALRFGGNFVGDMIAGLLGDHLHALVHQYSVSMRFNRRIECYPYTGALFMERADS
jgi:hypothetical protein